MSNAGSIQTVFGSFVLLCALHVSADAQILKREPPMGGLQPGQRVLVDDGTCPRGQIKEAIGGNHVDVGGNARVRRTYRCVARRQ